MKIIALYLPQFHEIHENNIWWGKGFTEWTNVKKGKKLFDGHYQPRVPLNENYYELNVDVMKWQVEIAKKHNVFGFCVYHYWFDGKLLLEKPMEEFLKDRSIDFPIFFSWANENWTNAWKGEEEKRKTLISNDYSNIENIKKHFHYMLKFFKDDRYMKENNMPIFSIYAPEIIEYKNLKKMIKLWNELAIKEGFNGIHFIYQSSRAHRMMSNRKKKLFNLGIQYLPSYVDQYDMSTFSVIKKRFIYFLSKKLRKINNSILDKKIDIHNTNNLIVKNYDDVWEKAIKNYHDKIIPGAFVDWDNSPRRGLNSKVIVGSSPEKFEKHLIKQIEENGKKHDAIILFAWNEWGEGGYLEPDQKFGYGYLEAVNKALEVTNEIPKHYSNYKTIFKK
ncbi:MAG: glycoside hydrolase family 99-like domain-containing protein [Acholeplasmatales bacterium]